MGKSTIDKRYQDVRLDAGSGGSGYGRGDLASQSERFHFSADAPIGVWHMYVCMFTGFCTGCAFLILGCDQFLSFWRMKE